MVLLHKLRMCLIFVGGFKAHVVLELSFTPAFFLPLYEATPCAAGRLTAHCGGNNKNKKTLHNSSPLLNLCRPGCTGSCEWTHFGSEEGKGEGGGPPYKNKKGTQQTERHL